MSIFVYIVCGICYIIAGLFIAGFASDDPRVNTPIYITIFLFWPIYIIAIIIGNIGYSLLSGITKFLAFYLFGICIEREYTGPNCGQYIAKYRRDLVIIKENGFSYTYWKPEIEKKYSYDKIIEYNNPDSELYIKGFKDSLIGQFWADLNFYASGIIEKEYMIKTYSKICPNIKTILTYNWNF